MPGASTKSSRCSIRAIRRSEFLDLTPVKQNAHRQILVRRSARTRAAATGIIQ
jgi:hypothetical protein